MLFVLGLQVPRRGQATKAIVISGPGILLTSMGHAEAKCLEKTLETTWVGLQVRVSRLARAH